MTSISDEKIKNYGKQLSIDLDVDNLIESHKRLREWNSKEHTDYLKHRETGFKQGYEEGKRLALEQDFISLERLEDMTLSEICSLIKDD